MCQKQPWAAAASIALLMRWVVWHHSLHCCPARPWLHAYLRLLLQLQANSKSADPKDIQVTEKDKKTVNGEVEMESVSNRKGEPMEIDKMQIEG